MKKENKSRTAELCVAAVIAALYVVLTLISSAFGLSSGAIQLRLSEALCVLPCFTAAAIPGLTVGCFISNLITSGNILDIVFGTLATLVGALGAYGLRSRPYLASLPTVAANALIIPPVIVYGFGMTDMALPIVVLTVAVGELLSASLLGTGLLLTLKKYKFKL